MILTGVRVVEWSGDLAGAFSARLLADLGAEVIKVESPQGGDALRGDHSRGPTPNSALFGYLNHSKRSVTLDPRTPRGAALFRELVKPAAVLIESELSSQPGGAQPSVEELRAASPGLVVLTITPHGLFPPEPARPSTPLTLQHESSYAGHQARPVSDPALQPPVGCTDREGPLSVGVAAAVSAMWGLLSGAGAHIDMASHDFYAAHLSPDPLAEWCAGERQYNRARDAFAGTEVAGGLIWMLQCADGWLFVSPREQHQWQRWVGLLGNPSWAKDDDLCGTREARRRNYGQLRDLMSEALSSLTRQNVFEGARRDGIACFPVSEAADLISNEQLSHRDFFDSLDLGASRVPVPGLPFKLKSNGTEMTRARSVQAPTLGGANAEVLGGRLKLSAAEMQQLVREGII